MPRTCSRSTIVAFRGTFGVDAVFGSPSNVASGTTSALTVVATVTVTPSSATIVVGQGLQLTATARNSSGTVIPSASFTWITSDASRATVSQSGLATGASPGGPVAISATSQGQSGESSVTVVAAPVASVTVSPGSVSVVAGQTVQLTATTRDANGNVLTGRVVTWATNNPARATVNGSGLVTGVAAGSAATITATSEGQSGTSSVTVTASQANITYVQGVSNSTASRTLTVSLPAVAVQGDLIVVGIDFRTTTFSSISDNRGNVYTQIGTELSTPEIGRAHV